MHLLVEQVESSTAVTARLRAIGTDSIYGVMVDGSVDSDPSRWLNACFDAPRVVLRCAKPRGGEASDRDDVALLASWSAAGWARFDEDLGRFDRLAREHGIELMIRPSASGMLSDAICTCSWARRSESLGCSLMLDPMGWIVGSMMGDIEDHLCRISALCSQCPKVGAVLVRSIGQDEMGGLIETTLDDGMIDPELIVSCLGGLVRSAPAVVALDRADLDRF